VLCRREDGYGKELELGVVDGRLNDQNCCGGRCSVRILTISLFLAFLLKKAPGFKADHKSANDYLLQSLAD
jgi:hypothetical protein